MKRFALICGFLSLLLLVVPERSSSVIIRGPVAGIHTRSFRHQGTLYIPMASLARAFGLVLKESGGPIFIFESPQCRLVLAVGSREARINGETVRMIGPAEMVDGKLSVPIYLAIQTMKDRFPARIEPVEPPPPSPKETARIVLDPGHGGADTGAVGSGGLEEKEVALEIAGKVKAILEGKGYEVLMTRTGDGFVSLKKRARLANRNEAELFVSIHANAADNHLARGTEIFYYASASDPGARKLEELENAVLKLEEKLGRGNSRNGNGELLEDLSTGRFLQSVLLARKVQRKIKASLNRPDRGIKGGKFYVLKYTKMPSVLVETGFLSNHDERELLLDDSYREKMAGAIGEGIADYLENGLPRKVAGL